ncbi:uncharacterized protein LOC120196084 [Hibiscus syriacus]|uniref:uncharacterized protein LOC120196084 n=1 Tax=Hibiscus syriacus TaxID=106335 RepID=UPI00192379E8|nr:uncharacterized protein LOC120196084 [Hibiscus syriacus]
MAAINPAVAAQLSVGVLNNPATKSRQTIEAAATNPAVKNGATSILSLPAQSPLLHTSSVPRCLGTRIMAANPEVLPSENLTGILFFTECQFGNFSVQNLKLENFVNWHGFGDLPETISQNQPTVPFRHTGDSHGSVGAVSYVVGEKIRWIIAWSNSADDSLKLNKVYSEINEVDEREVDWGSIRKALDQSVSKYNARDDENGYSADLWIDPTTNTPSMIATLNSNN